MKTLCSSWKRALANVRMPRLAPTDTRFRLANPTWPLNSGDAMILPFPSASSRGDARSKPAALWRPEYPIEQRARSRTLEGPALLRETRRHSPARNDTFLVADHSALRILGRSAAALKGAIADLAHRHGDALLAEPPSVRYVHAACVLEPWMEVLVNAPERYCAHVKRDFLRRRGNVRRIAWRGAAFVLEGEAPLADLLGFDEWLGDLTKGGPYVSTWLSRYRPIDHGPDAA
jgi:hypothetical protein